MNNNLISPLNFHGAPQAKERGRGRDVASKEKRERERERGHC